MILGALISTFGFVLVLFLPGFVLSMLILKKLSSIDRFLISVGLSIAITAFVAFMLSGRLLAFGLMTSANVWLSLLVITIALTVIYLFKR
jgi:uncharacterized membrane protein